MGRCSTDGLSVTLHLSTILLCQNQLSPSLSPLTMTINSVDHSYLSLSPSPSSLSVPSVGTVVVAVRHSSPTVASVASVRHCHFASAPSPCGPLVHDPRCSPLLRRSHLSQQLCFCSGLAEEYEESQWELKGKTTEASFQSFMSCRALGP